MFVVLDSSLWNYIFLGTVCYENTKIYHKNISSQAFYIFLKFSSA